VEHNDVHIECACRDRAATTDKRDAPTNHLPPAEWKTKNVFNSVPYLQAPSICCLRSFVHILEYPTKWTTLSCMKNPFWKTLQQHGYERRWISAESLECLTTSFITPHRKPVISIFLSLPIGVLVGHHRVTCPCAQGSTMRCCINGVKPSRPAC
jgi:hypothetical protein